MLKCTFSDGDSDFRKYANAARRAELERTVNSKEAPATRLAAAIALRDDFPEGAAKAEGLVKSLTAQVAAAERDELKRQGVRIGMSQDDVIASSWGRPRKVNRTTTPTHVREQWVYDGGYLYFTDGVLDAIQN